MKTDRTRLMLLAPRLASWAAVFAVVVGAMVLIGWAFDVAALKSILPDWVAMKANTAVCFILTGVALLLTARPPATFNPQISIFFLRIARLCGLLAGLIGLLTLGEYIFDWNPGIDQWLFLEPNGTVGTSYPGRMAPEAALSFVLLAVALWITGGSRKNRWTVLAAVNFGLVVTAFALAAMQSYFTPALGAYGWFGLTIMAMHTAVLFGMLGLAVIAISWRQDILPWSFGRNITAALACGMMLLVIIGFNTNRSQFWLVEANRKVTSSEEVLSKVVSIQLELTEAQAHSRGYVITGDKGFMDAYLGDISEYHIKMDALRHLIADNPEQQQQLTLIETNVDLLQRWTQQFIDASRIGKSTARRKIDTHGDEFLESIHGTFDQIEDGHLRLIRELKQKSEGVAQFSYITIITGTLVSLLIFLTAIFRFNSTMNERKLAETMLRESEEKLRIIFEGALDGIVLANTETMRFTAANPEFCRMLGYSSEEVTRAGISDIHLQQDLPHAIEQFEKLLRGEIQISSDIPVKRKDGSVFYADIKASSVNYGGKTYLLGIFRDITERKQAEVKQAEQLEELRRWHELTLGREERIIDLKHEVNDLLGKTGKHPRYPSAESQDPIEE
jgi:PAS domain S-box-containing protein